MLNSTYCPGEDNRSQRSLQEESLKSLHLPGKGASEFLLTCHLRVLRLEKKESQTVKLHLHSISHKIKETSNHLYMKNIENRLMEMGKGG